MDCGIIYKKIVMWAGYDEQMINYEWPKVHLWTLIFYLKSKISFCLIKNEI